MRFASWASPLSAGTLMASCIFARHATAAFNNTQLTGFDLAGMSAVQFRTATATNSLLSMPSASLLAFVQKPIVRAFDSVTKACPAKCSDTGNSPGNWTVYHDTNRLSRCNETMLLDFAVYNPLDDPDTQVTIRSCSGGPKDNANSNISDAHGTSRRLIRDGISCIPAKNDVQVIAPLQIAWLNSTRPSGSHGGEVVAAARQMLGSLAQQEIGCNSTILFASSGQVAIGLYGGSQIQAQGVPAAVLQEFIDHVQSEGMGISQSMLVQLCGTNNRGADYALGIFASTTVGRLALAQSIVKSWSDGSCVTAYGIAENWRNTSFLAPVLSSPAFNSSMRFNNTNVATPFAAGRALHPRGHLSLRSDCTTVQVVSGDSCGSLATKCGITGATFTKYNSNPTLCSTLAVGQHVCCSAGSLPNFAPKPKPDGSCASYIVVAGDYCDKIASSNSLTIALLATYNTNTWGWTGCANLQAGVNICLSTGTPPMPAPVPNAVCGPQVVGSMPTAGGSSLASLNPCPLNACCDIWGQCGTTTEFCTVSNSTTGAPGTAAPGTNGCISNCGTDIVFGSPPTTFFKIAYFEGFNHQRSCLTMDITQIDTSKYTHVHLSFATITPDFDVDISGVQSQFSSFISLRGIKRILSFGGWSFSTDQDTYPIFRRGVSPGNRDTFIANLVTFVDTYNIDGLDFDWEYPGAPDIPGIPPGNPDDGVNYFLFLYYLRQALPNTVSLSIAAPASFWYLKGFPIDAMAVVLDYIIYMTYDLHGQWDYGNKFSNPGCPQGNCLRSHVNLTETINALSMITKAGVPSSKVIVGVTSYGRSFEMTTPGCTGENCHFVGPGSAATPGRCTGTAGYIADAEINGIINSGNGVVTYTDNSFSNILVYNNVQWVAYMDDENKATRTAIYQAWSFGGTSDWAVDLQSYVDGSADNGASIIYIDPIIFVEPSPQLGGMPPCTLVMPLSTMPTPTTISFAPISTWFVLGGSIITSVSPLPITTAVISFFSVPIESVQGSTTFALTTSLKPQPLIVSAGGSSTTIDFPATIPATTSSSFYALPTTVITSNGVTQTFSQAQFTELATITAQTTITTTVTEVGYSGSSATTSTTIIPFWVQVGGFYWSPVPLPTLPPIPIPNFPSFPKIPSPPCFKLFGIFSIDCPPDKSQPTTTFRPGPPSPTCKSGCGTLCTADCSSPDETTSTQSSSSTSSSSSSSSFQLCSQGCSSCSGPAEATSVPSNRNLESRALVDPSSYESIDKFMTVEVGKAIYQVYHGVFPDISTGKSAALRDEKFSMSVQGLYGCTSVIIMSEQGIYMSHFWEDPSFISQENFQQQVLNVLVSGYTSFHGTWDALPPIQPFVSAGGMFGPESHPLVFIFTPRQRELPIVAGPDGSVPYNLIYPGMVSQLQGALRQLLGKTATVIEYHPDSTTLSKTTAQGKVLFQYDPANSYSLYGGCYKQVAVGRIWFQTQSYSMTWNATDNQLVLQQQTPSRVKKRQGAACLLSSPTVTASELESPVPMTGGIEPPPPTTTLPSLPTLSKQCVTSSLINCKYIYFDVDPANCPTTRTTELLPASCTNPPAQTTGPSSPSASTLVYCYYAEWQCKGGGTASDCTKFKTASYYWFWDDGSSTCLTVFSRKSYLGINTDTTHRNPSVEDSRFHFPAAPVILNNFDGDISCSFQPGGGSGSTSAADSYYNGLPTRAGVGEVDCVVGASNRRGAFCYKAYKDFSTEIPDDVTNVIELFECYQLFTCDWQNPVS